MFQRIEDILAGCGDGNPTISVGPADAQALGIDPGSHKAKDIAKALGTAKKNAAAAEKKAAAPADK